MPISILPFARPVAVDRVASSLDERMPGDAEWLGWSVRGATEPVVIEDPSVLLDAFTRLARPVDAAAVRGMIVAFATTTFAPWAYCDSGDLHADFDARGLSSVPQTRDQLKERLDHQSRNRRPQRPPRGSRIAGERAYQWIPGMLNSAASVNALRAIVASVSQGRQADPRLWRVLWPAGARRPFPLGSLEAEDAAARFVVGGWLQATHVEIGPAYGLPKETARVGGVAGALAVAVADEFDPRNRVSRCSHRLRDGRCADLSGTEQRGAQRCGVTWRPGRRNNGGGLPPRCPTCDNLHRVNVHRKGAPS